MSGQRLKPKNEEVSIVFIFRVCIFFFLPQCADTPHTLPTDTVNRCDRVITVPLLMPVWGDSREIESKSNPAASNFKTNSQPCNFTRTGNFYVYGKMSFEVVRLVFCLTLKRVRSLTLRR